MSTCPSSRSAGPSATGTESPAAAEATRARSPHLPAGVVIGLPALVALGFGLWGIATVSLGRDEIITVSVARRSLYQIARVLPHMDVVHSAYYLAQHFTVGLFGYSETAVRMPSVIGTVLAAAAVAALGRKLIDPLGGLLSGLLYAVTPLAGQYAHFARQYAIVAAGAAAVTLLFVRALERHTRRAYLAYAAGMAALGILHFFALLLITAHVITVLCGGQWRRRLPPVLASCAVAMLPVLPIVAVARGQQQLIGWARPPGLPEARDLLIAFAGGPWAAAVVIVLVLIGVLPVRGPQAAVPESPVPGIRALALPWLLCPPVILFLVSQVHPAYAERYVLLSLPPMVLLAAAGAVRLRPRLVGMVVVGLALALMIPQNVHDRRESSTPDQFREASQVVGEHARPGDAILFLPGGRRPIKDAYPQYYAKVTDIALDKSAVRAADFSGDEINAAELRVRMTHVKRVWLMAFSRYVRCARTVNLTPMSQAKMDILTSGYRRDGCRQVIGMTVELFVRP